MSGSEAEERIRGKAEAMLRQTWPLARIVHELVLEQGGCRIDLAAITPNMLVAVEVKSERDVLDRLAKQVRAAVPVATEVWVCCAAEHAAAIHDLIYSTEPAIIPGLWRCTIWKEDGDSLKAIHTPRRSERVLDAPAILNMLWAEELRSVCARFVGAKATRTHCIYTASELMTGREIRQAAYRQLMSRPFPRADKAVDFKVDAVVPAREGVML